MKTDSGGTAMWCPRCKRITTCKAVPGASVTYDAGDYAQRRYHTDHDDLNWFQRGRRCLSCNFGFLTGEARLAFLFELVELRDALSDLKKNAETYAQQSKDAAASLDSLTKSLDVLRALKIYKDA